MLQPCGLSVAGGVNSTPGYPCACLDDADSPAYVLVPYGLALPTADAPDVDRCFALGRSLLGDARVLDPGAGMGVQAPPLRAFHATTAIAGGVAPAPSSVKVAPVPPPPSLVMQAPDIGEVPALPTHAFQVTTAIEGGVAPASSYPRYRPYGAGGPADFFAPTGPELLPEGALDGDDLADPVAPSEMGPLAGEAQVDARLFDLAHKLLRSVPQGDPGIGSLFDSPDLPSSVSALPHTNVEMPGAPVSSLPTPQGDPWSSRPDPPLPPPSDLTAFSTLS